MHNPFELAHEASRLLHESGLTLALAESCTGGLVASYITDIPGSSSIFDGGVVAYSNEAKAQLLDVSWDILEHHGAVSSQCAAAMAQGARRSFGSDIAVSVTGIAGPGGGSADKPVGLTYLHLSTPQAEIARQETWRGDRLTNKRQSAQAVLHMLITYLKERA
jgi:PncC family amidohydrolase